MDTSFDVEDLSDQIDRVEEPPIYAGPYSRVYRGFMKGECVAIKVLHPIGSTLRVLRRKILREKTVWAMLDHPNILPLYGYAEEDKRFQPLGALVSPWCSHGSATAFLAKYGGELGDDYRINLWKGVIRGVQYLHEYNPCIVHGDLKPANVLIDSSCNPRICDFGLVKLFLESGQTGFTTTSQHTGTVRYLSPELVAGEQVSTASDIYALGCIGLEFIFSLVPYHKRVNCPPVLVLLDISNGVSPIERPSHLASNLEKEWDVIGSCLCRDPTQRPTISDIVSLMRTVQPTEPTQSMEHMQPAEDMEIMQVMQAMQPTQMPLISMPPGLPSGMAHGNFSYAPHSHTVSTGVAGQCAIFGCGRPGLVDGVPSFYCETHMQQSNPSELLVGSAQPSAAAAVLMAAQQKAAGGLCQLPGCSTPVWVDLQGVHHQYCGKMHMIQHQSGIGEAVTGSLIYNPPGLSSAPPTLANPCLVCNCREQWPGSSFCAQDCSQMARAQAPGLLEIPVTHPKFKEIENEFKSTWVWRPVPAVKAIYMILTKETDQKNFRDYRDMVEAKNNHKSHGAPAGNQQRRWHGTTRICKLGEPLNSTLCTNTDCMLCNIIRSSFDMKYASGGLFGRGIYTYATPSWSNSYISVASDSRMRPILLNKVIVGKGYSANGLFSRFTAPPVGYDSVLSQRDDDEVIVYSSDAIRPAYLILFT